MSTMQHQENLQGGIGIGPRAAVTNKCSAGLRDKMVCEMYYIDDKLTGFDIFTQEFMACSW